MNQWNLSHPLPTFSLPHSQYFPRKSLWDQKGTHYILIEILFEAIQLWHLESKKVLQLQVKDSCNLDDNSVSILTLKCQRTCSLTQVNISCDSLYKTLFFMTLTTKLWHSRDEESDKLISTTNKSWGAGTAAHWLCYCLGHKQPLFMQVQIVFAPFPIQLPANVPYK